MRILACSILLLAPLALAQSREPDTDGDGLPDFQEIHKYRTDPERADSDGDGTPDGDGNERREFSYSVRAVLHVIAPFDVACMTDDWQDARVIEEEQDLLKVEVVVYPFSTAGDAIGADPDWRKAAARMKEWTRPGVTTNWNPDMRQKLSAELAERGVDVGKATDRELALQAARWLMERAEYEDSFTTFAVEFSGRRATVVPGAREAVEATLRRFSRTLEEQWDRELFGAGMFATRLHGSCTSCAIYLATGLKALGLPARTVVWPCGWTIPRLPAT